MSIPELIESSFTLTRHLTNVSYSDAVDRVTVALATEGFGVLTEIDVKATMKKKLDKDERPFVILGSCKPPLAYQALSALPAISLLLPCNVVVAENDDKSVTVGIIDPVALFAVVGRDDLTPVAQEAQEMLTRVLDLL